ncbi:MAG TPA: LemA family protein [Candidatus Absconditabacterales bacterium]|nr:LemA family protein [Candidatus Absconditabacterales bacterium]
MTGEETTLLQNGVEASSKGLDTKTILLIILGLIILYMIVKYNKLIRLKNNIKNSFADIDVQIKLRFDLIENLVSTVKGYASHEKETLTKLTEARTSFLNAGSAKEKLQADDMLTGALKNLFAVSENYPDLKANQNFLQLQTELSDIENKIAAARRFFNSSINEYNSTIQSFPTNIVAKLFGFKYEDFFAITDNKEKEVPKVSF